MGRGHTANYFGPAVPGRGGLPAYLKFLKRTLIACTEDTQVICDSK